MKQLLKAFVLVASLFMSVAYGLHQAHGAEQIPGRVAELEEVVTRSDTTYHVAHTEQAPTIDGQIDEWASVPAMRLDRDKQGRGLSGTNDLSGSMRLLWDQDAVYLCIEVIDNIHHAPDWNSGWENDCVQFIFDDYMNGHGAGYNGHGRGYCLTDTPDGPVLSMYTASTADGELHEVVTWMSLKSSVQPNGVRVFELALPWSHLKPTHPWVLGRLGFSFSINDNDGFGFKGARFWTEGLLWGRDASKFGVLLFDEAIGSRDAILELAPEWNLFRNIKESRWLKVRDVNPFTHARILVNRKQAGQITANLSVRRVGDSEPVAVGRAEQSVGTGETAVFAWDLSQLNDGKYELVYDIPELQLEPRLPTTWYQLDLNKAHHRKARLTERYGIDRPWDDFAGEPALIRRHRGMVAVAFNWFEFNRNLTGDALDAALGEMLEMIGSLKNGEDYLAGRRYEFWSAYYSQFDGSGQLFVTYVPPDYDASRTWPLIVNLHGAGSLPEPNRNKREHKPYIRVDPWGRGSNGYRGIGENDVLEVIDYMKTWYSIDPSRVYIKGGSMGGRGTWSLAANHPGLFAAAGPDCGASNQAQIENLRHVPLSNRHGLLDSAVPVDMSRYGVSRLQQLGYSVSHYELAEAGHALPSDDEWRNTWMFKIQRPARPATITYSCQTPETGRAYWLCVRRFSNPHLRARVVAAMSGSDDDKVLTLAMENVDVLELDVTHMPLDNRFPLTLQMGEEKLDVTAPLPKHLFVRRTGDNWSVSEAWSPEPANVRPYRPGAAANLYTDEPLLVVYGTAGDEARVNLLEAGAKKLAGFGSASQRMALGGSPVKPDTAVTARDIANFNLILLGGVLDNELVRRMADRLPFTINAQNELIAGDREPVSMNGAGLRLFYYNPLAPERLMFLLATDEKLESIDDWLKTGWHDHPMTGGNGLNRGDQSDLIVQVIGGPVRRKMQFDRNWQWRNVPGTDQRLPHAMAARRALAESEVKLIQLLTGSDFAFSWSAKKEEMSFDSNFITLADVAIENTSRKTLLGRMTGEELVKMNEKWLREVDVCVYPTIDPNNINPKKEYEVALPPSFCRKLMVRQKNLRNVRAGPDLDVTDLWTDVFNL